MLDCAINQGAETAVSLLHKAVSAKEDGKIAPVTLNKAIKTMPVGDEFIRRRTRLVSPVVTDESPCLAIRYGVHRMNPSTSVRLSAHAEVPGLRIGPIDFNRTFAKPTNLSYPRKRVSTLFSGLLDSRLRGNDGKRKSWGIWLCETAPAHRPG